MSGHMSPMYRAMIFAAVATLYFYRKDVIPLQSGETYGAFAKKNQKVIDRMLEELRNLFSYGLSSDQLGMALKMYTADSTSIDDRPAFRIDDDGKIV